MSRYIALLRAINLGTHNQIKMPALREGLAGLGYTNVETYLQSGNVVLTTDSGAKAVQNSIGALLKRQFDVDVHVLVQSAADWQQIIDHNPFLDKVESEIKCMHATLLFEAPDAGHASAIPADLGGADRWQRVGRVIYLFCPNGYGRTKLTNALFERKLKVAATTRNWKTVLALQALAEGQHAN